MKPDENKIMILESGGSHDEILNPQFRFLKESGFEIHLIIRKSHLERIGAINGPYFITSLAPEKGWKDRWRNLLKIRNYLADNKINNLIINTCQGAFIRDLCLLLPRNLNITGISHNPQKLNQSFNQKLINRKVKKYLVLSDNILEKVRPLNPDLSLASFYPVFLPEVSRGQKKKDFIISVPGAVDLDRRDYYHLLEELKIKSLNSNIQIIFLGRCKSESAKKFRARFSSFVDSGHYEFFDDFIPEKKFLEIIAGSDIILPLITPDLKSFEIYRDYKITGGINLALGFKIPLLLEESLGNNPDYKKAAFFYKKTRLVEMINYLSEHYGEIKEKKLQLTKERKFNYSYQKKNYIAMIMKIK